MVWHCNNTYYCFTILYVAFIFQMVNIDVSFVILRDFCFTLFPVLVWTFKGQFKRGFFKREEGECRIAILKD